ncbi:cyclase family protein [Thermococcus aggregans]|uniref:Cyclase family protein n=1 Tax=Thermococcus aggregans TaxID=110163 RepID=A0A9E7SQA5_THEAG|nr:cyclase family protein [Thermococcus aggregans]USS41711.1 cyclase family protein [Thermococcus aggregans]
MIVDLTLELSEETTVYPGDPRVEIRKWTAIEKDGYYTNALFLGEHSGTHVDAPAHFIPGGKTIDEIPLERFIGKGVVLDVSSLNENIKPQDITKSAEVVLFYTGGREVYLSEEGAKYLVELGVKVVGIDAPTIGDSSTHKVLLSNEVVIFENLTNLQKLIGKEFTFFGVPLKIKNGSGSPVRAFAIIKEEE